MRRIALHPGAFLCRWNYKTALLSAIARAGLFYTVNAGAGPGAALSAMRVEFGYRFVTAGFYGALTQTCRHVEPPAAGTAVALVLVPLVSHCAELCVHWLNGTAHLRASLAASVAFTVLSTAFNLFAMRAGALLVGPGRQSLVDDLAAMPRLAVRFVATIGRGRLHPWR